MSAKEFSQASQTAGAPVRVVEKLTINRILCPVDFSEFSRRALRYAISLARHFGAQLHVQHIAEIPQSLLIGGAEPTAMREWRSQLPRFEDDIRQLLKEHSVESSEANILVQEGPVLDQILDTVVVRGIDLLVMGTHGHKGFSRFVLGSIAEGIIHRAPCPVLVINKPEKDFAFPEEPDRIRLRTMLLATDFSVHADRALLYALRWACEWAAKVVIFHAVPEVPPGTGGMLDLFPEYNPFFQKQVANAWEKLSHVVPESVRPWCEVNYEVRHGNPKQEILNVAEEKKADLIIVGARGAGVTTSPWGSVSSAIVRAGRFPVLVVRAFDA